MKRQFNIRTWLLLNSFLIASVFGQTEWTIQNSGTTEILEFAVWTGSRFVVVGLNGTILTSTDGISWTSHNSDTSMQLFKVMSAESLLVAFGWGPIITSSDDGITWTTGDIDWESGDGLNDIAYTGSRFVIVGANHSEGRTIVLTSPDGITWIYQSTPVDSLHIPLESVEWNGNQLVAVGGGGTILTSPDGITWTKQFYTGNDLYFMDVTWTGDQFVAVGPYGPYDDAYIYTSPDGTTWTRQYSSFNIYEITWCGNLLLAHGGKGMFLTSPDGVEWTKQTIDTSNILCSIIWTGSSFVAVGTGGTILTSLDGTTWTSQSSGTDTTLYSIVMADDLLVAVGRGGIIITSPVDNVPVEHSSRNPYLPELAIKSTRNFLTVELPVSLRGSSVCIYSLAGKKVLTLPVTDDSGRIMVNTRVLASGVYQIVIEGRGAKVSKLFAVGR